jgi:hypothetical protein
MLMRLHETTSANLFYLSSERLNISALLYLRFVFKYRMRDDHPVLLYSVSVRMDFLPRFCSVI